MIPPSDSAIVIILALVIALVAVVGFFFALVIVQAVVGGMFGFSFDLVGSIVCGVFIAVEVFIPGAIVLLWMLDHARFPGVYLVLGIVAISAGAILAAWLGAMPSRPRQIVLYIYQSPTSYKSQYSSLPQS